MTEVAELRAKVEALERLVAEQRSVIEAQQARIEDLERRLAQDSGNSSKPPSSDPPWQKPRKRGRPKKRRRGGQPGHRGQARRRFAAKDVDHVVNHRTECCEDCGALLLGEDPAPLCWQVAEVPAPSVVVTEHRVHRLRCCSCGHLNRPEPPAEMASAFGASVHATAAWLTGRLGLSKRNVQEIFQTFFGLGVSLGSVSAMERRVAQALEVPYSQVLTRARASPVKYADETPWYEDRQLSYLWVLADAAVAVYYDGAQRQAAELLNWWAELWTFLEVDGMEPTNNMPERAMRRGVLWRKRSFGTDSPAGSRFAERILTAVESLRLQSRDVVPFLAEAFTAHINQQPAPSLLP